MSYRYWRRPFHSQNFLLNPELVRWLIGNSSIGKKDVVLEIGPGKGIITRELAAVAKKVIAVEIDSNLYLKLKNKFRFFYNIVTLHNNILRFRLPSYPYKVFSNIPFSISADIIRKLTSNNNFQEGYLIVQKELAQRFIGKPYDSKNQMVSALLRPWFKIDLLHEFLRSDFYPTPKVDSVMIRITRLKKPLIPQTQEAGYRRFILYLYNRKRVSRMRFGSILELYKNFAKNASRQYKLRIAKSASKLLVGQGNIQKIHRTRKDKRWKKF